MASSLMASVIFKTSLRLSVSRLFYRTSPRLFEVSPCWNCSTLHDTSHSMHCHQCNVLCAPPSQTNFFELMQQPKHFEIDLKKLAKIFKQLQSQLHPDRYSTREEQELKHSENWSPLVNEAYSTLMDPMRRALYLLEIFGNPLLEGDQPVLDPDFLMDIMEFNEEVDEVISKEDIADLRDKIRTELERLHNELKEEFSQQNTGSAKIVVAKMQYYHNLRYKVKDKELELGIVD